jgi:organic hydroperoxide reductase OsmC/OhrA
MLTFIDLARRAGLTIDSYEDEAIGVMERIAPLRMAITKVTLRPRISYGGTLPDQAKLDELHHQAHEMCFIANSVTTEVKVEARP